MYRTLLTVALLALAAGVVTAALVVPTAATGVEDRSEGVVLEPSDGPNGQYAEIAGGELVLDFEQLNDDAVTTADEVFEVTATDAARTIWIESDVDGLRFYAGDDGNRDIGRSNPLQLSGGETASVGVSVDTRAAVSGTETFTIHVRSGDDEDEGAELPGVPGGVTPPGLQVTSLDLDRSDVGPGEPFAVTATVVNEGSGPVSGPVTLEVGGTVVDSQPVALEPGEETTVSFTWELDEPGTYEVSVSGVAAGSVTVHATEDVRSAVIRQLSSPMAFAVAPPAGLALLLVISRLNVGRRW